MTLLRKSAVVFTLFIFAALISTVVRPGYAQTSIAGPETKIAPWVLAHTADGATAEFLVVLTQQADLSAADKLPTKLEKGRYVYDTLYHTAQATQRPLVQWLNDRGIEHRAYYIVNLIWVKGDRSIALALANRSDVARLEGNPTIRVIEPRPIGPARPDQPAAIEPNITYVHAPDVWNMGFTGQGVVVGGQDTGYQWDHPALKNQYRGWNGSTASHDYNWHDSVHSGGGVCGANSTVPCDDDQHGTHTMGTTVGYDGGSNQIGMAPGAKWIGCRNMDQGNGTPATYLECFEFFLAPYPVGGTPAQGDPSKAPDVTTNSWGCPTTEGCSPNTLQAAVEAQRAAGIMTVVAAGNSGSACSTVTDPPSFYAAAYTVGALNTGTDNIASFSSRGPATIDGSNRRKPDITAPGTSIRSSIPGGGYSSAFSGTSMATPHVAGAVALLWSARPALTNQIAATEDILNNSATHISSSLCSSSGWPNNVYGYGRLDVKAAVDSVPISNSTLTGRVTDANTQAAIANALVQANGTITQTGSTTTNVSGYYTLSLSSGVYTLTAAAYGYHVATLSGVNVPSNVTTTQDITLTAGSFYVVSGTVKDAQTGWPLAATIGIIGYPGGSISTNPATGFYSVILAEGITYTFGISSTGYTPAARFVGPLTANRTENFTLNVDLDTCSAPGYSQYGVSEKFTATTLPVSWTVAGAPGWSFNNPGSRANETGGTGNMAIADSDNAGNVDMNTELRTPVLNLAPLTAVTLTFKTDFRYYSAGGNEVADVDVSVNGASGPWTNVWRRFGADYRGPHTEVIELTSSAAGQSNVMLRFRYYNAHYDWWWQVDDVQIGACVVSSVNAPVFNPIAVTQSGNPGASITYTLQLSNTDSIAHTFDILPGVHAWPISLPASLGPVSAQSTAPLTVTVSIPNNAIAYTADVVAVTARAQDNTLLQTNATLTTTANLVRGVQIDPASVQQDGVINHATWYTLTVNNTGNWTDTLNLSAALAQWPTSIMPLSVTLPAFGSTFANVVVSVPVTATPQLTDVVRVTVTGTGVSDFSKLITRALYPYHIYLPLILK